MCLCVENYIYILEFLCMYKCARTHKVSDGMTVDTHSYTVISFHSVAAGATWVMSSILWPFLDTNGSFRPNLSEVGCFNSSQNTVLVGTEFEGVPIVLLLNFIAFLVGVETLPWCVWTLNWNWSSVDGFSLLVLRADFDQPLRHNKEELLGLRTTGAGRRQRWVSSGFLDLRSLETVVDQKWQWHVTLLNYFWIVELLLTFTCLVKWWTLNFVFQVHWVNTPSLRTLIFHRGWSQVWAGKSVMVTLQTSSISPLTEASTWLEKEKQTSQQSSVRLTAEAFVSSLRAEFIDRLEFVLFFSPIRSWITVLWHHFWLIAQLIWTSFFRPFSITRQP